MKQVIKTALGGKWVCVVAACLGATPAYSELATIPVSADTFIISSAPDNNAGAQAWVDVGTDGAGGIRRGLLRFNLGDIPVGARINSATLRLSTIRLPPAAVVSTDDVFRLQVSWGEGSGFGNSGSPATAGGATWNARFFGAQNWTTPGARSDAAATASASAATTGGVDDISWTSAALAADVQFWLDHPAQNFGWLIASRAESTTRTVRGLGNGVLEVDFTPASAPNTPPTVAITNPTNGATFISSPSEVTIGASAVDSDGVVAQVQFFDGATLLGAAVNEPFRVTASLVAGSHALRAVATDDDGASSTSAVVNVTIVATNFANPIAARIPKGNVTIELKPIADGMVSPIGLAAPDDGTGRMFVYDQIGVVWLVTSAGRSTTPVLDVRARLVNLVGAYDERGLLGLAVHPNFAQNPILYTYTSEPNAGPADFPSSLPAGSTNNHQSVITEWRINPGATNQVDPATRREVLRIDEPQSNHNGGTMRFGPDGLLYVSLGDGGQANDVGDGHSPGGNGQDTTNILGSVIRIDVNGSNSANGHYGVPSDNPFVGSSSVPEIYAYGLRNPFNFSFDRGTGLLYLGDVGQNNIEEVDIIHKGGNYGWNIKEGTFYFVPDGGYVTNVTTRTVPPDLVDPIAEYDHDEGTAVIGGYVYRGSAIPALASRYVFGDWGTFAAPSGRLFYLDQSSAINELRLGLDDRPFGYYIKGFGEDASGELYVFGSKTGPSTASGVMYKLVPAPTSPLNVTSITVTNGTNVQTTWTGGVGPFAQQRKLRLDEPYCTTEMFVAGNSATTPVRLDSGFFRHVDTALHPAVPFTAILSGLNERPTQLTNTAVGSGIFSLEGSTLKFTVSYSGLSGAPIAAHFHGPSAAGSFGPVIIDLRPYHNGPYASTSGSFSGSIVLTDAQKALVLGGLTYVNIHTAAQTGGEMRGQVAPVNFQASLLDAYENPPLQTGARGLGSFALIGNQLTFNVTYRGLSGTAILAHIHGPAAIGQNASVLIDLAPFNGGSFGSNGLLSGSVVLTATQLSTLLDGQTYVNVHTPSHGGGEIRGQILPQVTAIPFSAWVSGLNERPTSLTNSAAGVGLFSLEGNRLIFDIAYSGLSGNPTGAHIHGPAATTNSAPIAIDLAPFANGTLGASGSFSGSTLLSDSQVSLVRAGQTYFNIHTSGNPAGEARGNLAPVLMTAFATGSAERPNSTASAGTAMGMFTLVQRQLTLNVVYAGLSGPASNAHIHAPAQPAGTASVVIDFAPFNGGSYGSSGAVSGSTNVSPTVLGYLIDGLGYINFHTAQAPGGEIRGQIFR